MPTGDSPDPRDTPHAWVVLGDALLLGLTHALGNRAFALGAISDSLSSDGGDAELVAALGREVARIRELLRLMQLLPGDGRPAQAVHPGELTGAAIALHAYHHTLGDVACSLECEDGVPAMRAPRAALTRLLLMFITAAKQEARGRGFAGVQLRCASAGGSVRIEAGGVGEAMPDAALGASAAGTTATAGRAAVELGGAVQSGARELALCALTLPALGAG